MLQVCIAAFGPAHLRVEPGPRSVGQLDVLHLQLAAPGYTVVYSAVHTGVYSTVQLDVLHLQLTAPGHSGLYSIVLYCTVHYTVQLGTLYDT